MRFPDELFMKRLLMSGLMGLMLLPRMVSGQPVPLYVNNGTVTNPTDIPLDVATFVNNGTIDMVTSYQVVNGQYEINPQVPFETSDTQNYTNKGTIITAPGWWFDNAPSSTGSRQLSANFVNIGDGVSSGIVSAMDDPVYGVSYLWINALNINTKGAPLFTVGANGWMQIVGTNVNLARSGLEVTPIVGRGSFNTSSNFFPDSAIYDEYWGATNMFMNSATLMQLNKGNLIVASPPHTVIPGPVNGRPPIVLENPLSDSYTNALDTASLNVTNEDGSTETIDVPTNIVQQAVFVGIGDPRYMSAQIRFQGGQFKTAAVALNTTLTNVITGLPETTTIYLVDTLASETNGGLLTNITTGSTFRPGNYLVSRVRPSEFAGGASGLGPPPVNFFYDPDFFSSSLVTNEYAAYCAFVDNLGSRPPAISGSITNLPGRINIIAGSLDLTQTRIQGEGPINIQTRHLVGSSNAVVAGPILSYNLGSTNGKLNVMNLVPNGNVLQVQGDIYAWSALWTNFSTILTPNYNIDTNTGTPTFAFNYTNIVQVTFYILMVDGSGLLSQQPAAVYDLATHATSVVISDPVTVNQSFLVDGQSFTLGNSLTFSGTVTSWSSVNAPSLKYFTNNGTLNIPNSANFGGDTAAPYSAFINNGTITASGQTINTAYFENNGTLVTGGGLYVTATSGKMQNGQVSSSADVQFSGSVLKLNQSTIASSGGLNLNVTSSLYDTGGGSSNVFTCREGFNLTTKPQTGDLLGTSHSHKSPEFCRS